jgi:hypothetical protein
VLGIQDHEELLARLSTGSGADLAQIVHSYRGRRRDPDGGTSEVVVELLRGTAGFLVEARTDRGRRATSGEPTWDLAAAIAATDWAGLDAPAG